MKNLKITRLFAAVLFVAALSLTACSNQAEEESDDDIEELVGTWSSTGGDGYIITKDAVVYDDGGWGFGFIGTIKDVEDNYIYYTKADGKFYAIAYKELKKTSCKFSNAYKEGGLTCTDTLKEAKKEFKRKNGYYEFYGEYTKSE